MYVGVGLGMSKGNHQNSWEHDSIAAGVMTHVCHTSRVDSVTVDSVTGRQEIVLVYKVVSTAGTPHLRWGQGRGWMTSVRVGYCNNVTSSSILFVVACLDQETVIYLRFYL